MSRRVFLAVGISLVAFLIILFIIGKVKGVTKGLRENSQANSLYNTALSLQEKNELEKATKLYQELITQFPQNQKAAYAWYKLAEIYEKENLWQQVKEAYVRIISDFPNFEQISAVEKKLWDVNIRTLFSPIITDKDVAYKIEPGDTLVKIAAKYNTTVDLIMRSNNLENDLIRPDERLKISEAKYSVIVDKSQNSLTLKQDDIIFKVYSVATGKDNCTPCGTFKIVEKLKNPDWYKSGQGIIPANSPKNILGTRWLGLSERKYGIHGCASGEDLGHQVTEGCIRMVNSDVEELFTILPKGTEVTIAD